MSHSLERRNTQNAFGAWRFWGVEEEEGKLGRRQAEILRYLIKKGPSLIYPIAGGLSNYSPTFVSLRKLIEYGLVMPWSKKGKRVRYWLTGNGIVWLAYDLDRLKGERRKQAFTELRGRIKEVLDREDDVRRADMVLTLYEEMGTEGASALQSMLEGSDPVDFAHEGKLTNLARILRKDPPFFDQIVEGYRTVLNALAGS